MKKQHINCSWPVKLFDFAKDETQENFSRGKLKVFFKGETADKRYFSSDFSEKVIKTLPYTPIVSFYDEEKDDFVGHAAQQNIYGIVDPCVEPTFTTDEDGTEWCICDTVYYTERPDKVGEIAKKIEGHSQSLELDPSSVEYVIHYDEKKHLKNIEFTAGKFVGVSVLGKDQKPAFTGSAFFSCDDFQEKMQLLQNYCEAHKNDQIQNGGDTMNFTEFMTMTWGAIADKVEATIRNEYMNDAYTYLVDMYDDSAIVRFYYYVEAGSKLMRVKYTFDGDKVVLGDVNEVVITYEDVQAEPESEATTVPFTATDSQQANNADADQDGANANSEDPTQVSTQATVATEGESEQLQEPSVEKPVEGEQLQSSDVSEMQQAPVENSEPENGTQLSDPAQVDITSEGGETSLYTTPIDTNVQATYTVESTPAQKESVENEQTSNEQENPSSASFTTGEREELETLKREKKIALVNSYKDSLSEEQITDFMAKVDELDEKDLEIALLRAYKDSAKEIEPMRGFSLPEINNPKSGDSFDNWVRQNLK